MTSSQTDDLIVHDAEQPPHHPVPTAGRGTLQIIVITLAALLVSLYQSVLIPLLGYLPRELNTTTTAVQWLLTVTLLVSALAVPIFGRLGDLYGKRRLLQVATLLGIIGSLICALSSDIVWLIVGRAFQGGAMAAIPLAISLLASVLPPERRAGAIAMVGAMLGIGGALGMPLSGVVAEGWDFHALFWGTFAAGIVVFVAMAVLVPESPLRSTGGFDMIGAVLLSAGLITLLLPLAQASDWGWGNPWTLGLLAASLVIFGIFGLHQLRKREPLVDLRAARSKPVLMAHVASLLLGIAAFATYVGTTVFVVAPKETGYGFGASVVAGGLCMLPSGLAMVPAALLGGRWINRIGATQTMSIGAALILVGWTSRFFFSDTYPQIIIGTAVVGAGIAMGSATLPALINHYTPVQEIAAANGLNTLVRSVGGSLASAIGGTIMGAMAVVVGGVGVPSRDAFQLIFVLCAVAAAITVALALMMPKVPPSGRPRTR